MVIRDDGYNANVLSKTFLDKHRPLLNIEKVPLAINHSSEDFTELTNEMAVVAEIQLEDYMYHSI